MNKFLPYHKNDPYSADGVAENKERRKEMAEEKKNPETEIVAQKVEPIVMPVVSPEEAVKAWKQYEALKTKIVTDNDVQKIAGKDYLKKSYWRKIATFFNLSCECIEERRDKDTDFFCYIVTYKATAPNGRFSYGDGACSSDEKGLTKTEHNTRSIAHTRAYNRAVSNLVGGGEVSAEEMPTENNAATKPQPEAKPQSPKPQGDLTEVLAFGKYKGQSFEQIHKINSHYLEWLLEQDWFNEPKWNALRDKVQIFLDEKRELEPEDEAEPY